jgi:hypothetical protein
MISIQTFTAKFRFVILVLMDCDGSVFDSSGTVEMSAASHIDC